MKTSNCNCLGSHSGVADVCEGALELPRYFPRQLLTPAEMTLEQDYFRARLRRHNLFLHGWGVVCGAEVCRVGEGDAPAPWKVRVKPGYVLGPQGDEILIDREKVVDLRTPGGTAGGDDPDDVWCTPVFQEPEGLPGTLFVAVRYQALPTRPVRVQPSGCGCDDTQCELSRLRDGFAIGLLTECPANHQNPPELDPRFPGPMTDCSDCPDSPWVVLAGVDLDPDGTIVTIDNCSCRRIVVAAGTLWRECTEILSVVPDDIELDEEKDVEIRLSRKISDPNPIVAFGDLSVTAVTVQDDLITATVSTKVTPPAPDPRLGPRTLTIQDSAKRLLASKADALVVKPRSSPIAIGKPMTEAPPKPRRGKGKEVRE